MVLTRAFGKERHTFRPKDGFMPDEVGLFAVAARLFAVPFASYPRKASGRAVIL